MSTAKIKSKILELPDDVIERLGIGDEEEFDVEVEDDTIVLRRHAEDALDPEQLAALRAAVAEGLDEYKAGETVGPFGDMDAFEAYLKSSS